MVIRWSFEAKKDYHNSLDYWEEHNGSFNYSLKIIKAAESLEDNLAENPYFSAKYSKKLDLYKRFFLNGRFALYYKIDEENQTVEIRDFRSTKQLPVF